MNDAHIPAHMAYVAMVANAIKACGTIVRLSPADFLQIVARQESPLVVFAKGGFFSTRYKYLTSYRGLAFYCKSETELPLPGDSELIVAAAITIPDI